MLVTGPTGSGKTTTLATSMSLLNQAHRKILTIEDPIEYELDGVNQTQAKPAIGLTFANALRSFLRHDPDVLMVGEMRDGETASIGIHAALTGHLGSDDAAYQHGRRRHSAPPRHGHRRVPARVVAALRHRPAAGARAVLALQGGGARRRRAQRSLPGASMALNGNAPTQLWRAVGCDRCSGTGYNDRIVISEVLDVDEEIRDLIQPNARPAAIEEAACRKGHGDNGSRRSQEVSGRPDHNRGSPPGGARRLSRRDRNRSGTRGSGTWGVLSSCGIASARRHRKSGRRANALPL